MAVPLFALVLIGLLGLTVGSFLNVIIYRVPRGESLLFPNSHCPSCDTPIKRRHNIPLFSWLALRGRCASCRVPISARYPAVEAATGALFVALTLELGLGAQLPAYLYLVCIAVILVSIGLDAQQLPDSIMLPSYVVGALLLMPAGAADSDWTASERAVIGVAAYGLIYLALALSYPHALALGDVKLAGLLGLYLGWVSWASLLVGLLAGFLIVGFGGTVFIAARRADTRQLAIPMAAPMVVAGLGALFITAPIVNWYATLVHLA
jgi:leader peptidase (prepilin peptidase) / N-methyltransferase